MYRNHQFLIFPDFSALSTCAAGCRATYHMTKLASSTTQSHVSHRWCLEKMPVMDSESVPPRQGVGCSETVGRLYWECVPHIEAQSRCRRIIWWYPNRWSNDRCVCVHTPPKNSVRFFFFQTKRLLRAQRHYSGFVCLCRGQAATLKRTNGELLVALGKEMGERVEIWHPTSFETPHPATKWALPAARKELNWKPHAEGR